MLSRVINNTLCCNLDNRNMLREVTVKIGLERINRQEGVTVEALLDSRMIVLVISLEFTRKQVFKLKKIERPICIRNIDSFFNNEEHIQHTVEVNIFIIKDIERKQRLM